MTQAATTLAEMMLNWTAIEARVKAAHPSASAEEVYRICAAAMSRSLGVGARSSRRHMRDRDEIVARLLRGERVDDIADELDIEASVVRDVRAWMTGPGPDPTRPRIGVDDDEPAAGAP